MKNQKFSWVGTFMRYRLLGLIGAVLMASASVFAQDPVPVSTGSDAEAIYNALELAVTHENPSTAQSQSKFKKIIHQNGRVAFYCEKFNLGTEFACYDSLPLNQTAGKIWDHIKDRYKSKSDSSTGTDYQLHVGNLDCTRGFPKSIKTQGGKVESVPNPNVPETLCHFMASGGGEAAHSSDAQVKKINSSPKIKFIKRVSPANSSHDINHDIN